VNKLFRQIAPWFFRDDSPAVQLALGAEPPTERRLRKFLDHYGLAPLLPWETWDEDHRLFIKTDSVGFVLELPPAPGLTENALTTVAGLVAMGEPGDLLNICLYASPHITPSQVAWGQAGSRPAATIYRDLAKRRLRYLRHGNWESLFSDQSFLLRDFRLFLSLSRPASKDGSAAEFERLGRMKNAMAGALQSAGMRCVALDPDGLVDLYDTLLNPTEFKTQAARAQGHLLLRDAMVTPDTRLLHGRDGLCLETTEKRLDVRCYTVHEFPSVWAGWSNQELIGSVRDNARRLPCPFLHSLTITYPDELDAIGQAKLKSARATQMADAPIGRIVTSWAEKKEEWAFVVRKLEEGNKLVRATYQVVLFADRDGDYAESQLLSLYRASGWRLYKERCVQLHAFLNALPACATPALMTDATRFRRQRTMLSWSAANLAPVVGEWKGTPDPLLPLIGRRGQLMHVNPWNNTQGNYNVAVAATSGAGKSVLCQELLFNVLRQGGRAWVFDRGRSYMNFNRLMGGEFLDFGDRTRKISLNPFTHIKSWEGDDETGSERVMLRALIAHMISPDTALPQQALAWIEQALNAVWEAEGRQAEITSLHDYFQKSDDIRQRDLADALFPFTKTGSYGVFFAGPSNISLDADFVVLEMQDLDPMPDLQTVVLLLLMMRITQTMYLGQRGTRRQLCVIDEAWKLLGKGNAGDFVTEGYRTARKFGGSFLTITQGVNDYYKSGTAQACLENSDWMFLLRQQDASLRQLVKTDRLPAGDDVLEILRSLHTMSGKYSEIAVISPEGLAIGRLVIDPFAEKLYSTRAEEFSQIQQAVRSGASLGHAIEQVAAGAAR
jgi:conjugal transfer ATP-binding protein TraC